MLRGIFVVAVAAVTLVGCITAAHNVDVDDIKNIRIERVDLSLDPAVTIGWYDAQKDYAQSRNQQGDNQATADNVAGTPAFRAYVASRLQARAKAILEPTLREALTGARPAVARVTVHHVFSPSLLRGLVTAALVGVAQVQSGMSVTIDFVDAKTNRVIVTYPKTLLVTGGRQTFEMGFAGYFSADPIDRMLAQLQDRLPHWLLKTAPVIERSPT
jgi:hypothetical protein